MDISVQELDRLVRSALAHLYDYAYLQNHPLAAMVDAGSSLDQVTRAQKLRRLLLDCIEALRSQEQAGAPAEEAARAHSILTYRYVDGVPIEEIAAKRALSERQAYRELEKGVMAVARILRDKMLAGEGEHKERIAVLPPAAPTLDDPLQTAQAEVARLRQAVNTEPLNLRDVLLGVQEMLAPISARTGIRIELLTPAPWPQVVADRVMLRQALLNLLTHALNAVVQGNLEVTVSGSQGRLLLRIAEVPHPTRTRPRTLQAAVGPLVAQALLEAQGGRLSTRDGEGHWLAEISLPLAGQVSILVIDDNVDLVALLQRYLAGHEVNVVGATDAEEALRLAEEMQPRLVTLDVMMPGLDGWEVLQRLKGSATTRDIPVVICSVLHEPELAQTMGASDYIAKPVRQTDLLETLTRWLGPLTPAE